MKTPKKNPENIDVLFVAGFGPIVRDPGASRKFYSKALGLPFKEETNGYLHTERLDGVKHFALWPLPQAAESCFGTDQWPGHLPLPQAWIEFGVGNIKKATAGTRVTGLQTTRFDAEGTLGPSRHAAVGTGRSAGGHNPYTVDAEMNLLLLFVQGRGGL